MFRRNGKVESHKLHGIPSGIFHPDVLSVIAGTTVMNPIRLAREVKDLRSKGVQVESSNLLISPDTQLIMPWHEVRDGEREEKRGRETGVKIETTKRGIGDTYSDHALREGFRMEDLLKSNEEFERKLDLQLRDQERYMKDASRRTNVNRVIIS